VIEQAVFYLFSLLLLFAATMVITVRNPVHAALFLVLGFFSSAALWLLLEAEFLAIALVLVYVGAVMVLFLFVVMMLDINLAVLREGFTRYVPFGIIVAGLMTAAMWLVVRANFTVLGYPPPPRKGPEHSNTEALGEVLYTDYVFAFEIAAVLLLVAIIAAIALTLRPSRQTRMPKPERQVAVKRGDRVRLVKMPSEKRR